MKDIKFGDVLVKLSPDGSERLFFAINNLSDRARVYEITNGDDEQGISTKINTNKKQKKN